MTKRRISPSDLDKMEIDEKTNEIYWNGRKLETVSRFKFSFIQGIFAFIVAIAALLSTVSSTISNYEKSCLLGFGLNCPEIDARGAGDRSDSQQAQ